MSESKLTFAEFLLEKKGVPETLLLQSLMNQLAKAPSLPELARQQRLLSDKELLSVVLLQSKERIDFRSACQKLCLWTETLQTKLDLAVNSSQESFTRFLLEQGGLTTTELSKALDEYLSHQLHQVAKPETKISPSLQPSSETPETTSFPIVELPSGSDSAPIPEYNPLLDALFEAFSDPAQNLMLNLSSKLVNFDPRSPKSELIDVLDGLLQKFHELKGICRLADLIKSEALIDRCEKLITDALIQKEGFDPQVIQNVGTSLSSAVKALWKIANSLKTPLSSPPMKQEAA